MVRRDDATAIAHKAASQGKFTVREHRGQRMAGRQRRELFRASVVKVTGSANQDRINALLRKTCEGRFEIAIGSCIRNNELQAQRARRRLQACDERWGTRKGRVHEYAEPGSIRYQLAEQL